VRPSSFLRPRQLIDCAFLLQSDTNVLYNGQDWAAFKIEPKFNSAESKTEFFLSTSSSNRSFIKDIEVLKWAWPQKW
jgi:hypothetical protein